MGYAQQTKTLEYFPFNEAVHYVETNLKSKYLSFEVSVVNNRNKPLEIWLLENGNRKMMLDVMPSNVVTLPTFSAKQAKQHQLYFTLSDKDIYLLLSLRFKPLPQAIAYDELFLALNDQNAIKHILGGEASWLNPDFDTLWLRFDAPSSITIKSTAVEKTIRTHEQDIMLKVDKDILGTRAMITFEHIPAFVHMLN